MNLTLLMMSKVRAGMLPKDALREAYEELSPITDKDREEFDRAAKSTKAIVELWAKKQGG